MSAPSRPVPVSITSVRLGSIALDGRRLLTSLFPSSGISPSPETGTLTRSRGASMLMLGKIRAIKYTMLSSSVALAAVPRTWMRNESRRSAKRTMSDDLRVVPMNSILASTDMNYGYPCGDFMGHEFAPLAVFALIDCTCANSSAQTQSVIRDHD